MSLNTRRTNYISKPKNKLPLKLIERILLISSLAIYLIIVPPFLKNQTLAGHDTSAHLTYLRIFTDALSQGQFPVRWIEWVNPGQSQPLFSFYQPFLYYLSSILHGFGLSILSSIYLTVLILWLISGGLMYLFIRNLTRNSLGGAVASLLYVFAPYHILDVFVRAAYPEVTALAFVPGIFYALERFFSTKKLIYLSLNAIFFALVFISHPPTLIMFGLPILGFVAYLIYREYDQELNIKNTLKDLFKILLSFILGVGISSFFSLPAFIGQNLIKASSLNTGYLDFHKHYTCLLQLFDPSWNFGVSVPGCSDQMSFQFGIVNWIILIILISILIYIKVKKLKIETNLLAFIFIFLCFFGLYMTTSFSQPFWEQTPYLGFIQFTWRFLAVAIFSISALGGILFLYIKNITYQLILFLVLIVLIPLLSFSYLKPAEYLPANYFNQDSENFYTNVPTQNGNAELGYMPKKVEVLPIPQNSPSLGIQIDDKSAQIKTLKNTFTEKEWDIQTTKNAQAIIFVHDFPGWRFKINDQELKTNSDNMYDLVTLTIPQGRNKITAKFENTPLITLANTISLISILIALIIPLYKLKLKLNINREEE